MSKGKKKVYSTIAQYKAFNEQILEHSQFVNRRATMAKEQEQYPESGVSQVQKSKKDTS